MERRTTFFILSSLSLFFLTATSLRAVIDFGMDPSNVAASQIVLVPFVTAFLLYLNRKNIFQSADYSIFPGVIVIMLGVGLFAGARIFGAQLSEADRLALEMSSVVVGWLGSFLFFYGTAVFRRGLFPLLFLVFSIPIPTRLLDLVIALLQRGSADMAWVLLKLTGTPVYREGFVFAMPGLVIDVAPECSGIRSVIAMFMLTLLAGYLLLQSSWNRVILVVAAIPIQILKNAVRIDTLSLLSIHVDPGFIQGRLHHEGGIVFFVFALLLTYPILATLMKSEGTRISLTPLRMVR